MALAAAGLAVSPLFEGLATTALREIRACMRPRRYAAGEAICREGATSDCLYLITRGVVEVVLAATVLGVWATVPMYGVILYVAGAPPVAGATHVTFTEVVPPSTADTSVTWPGAGIGVNLTSTQ